jgi:hypothetical protein
MSRYPDSLISNRFRIHAQPPRQRRQNFDRGESSQLKSTTDVVNIVKLLRLNAPLNTVFPQVVMSRRVIKRICNQVNLDGKGICEWLY